MKYWLPLFQKLYQEYELKWNFLLEITGLGIGSTHAEQFYEKKTPVCFLYTHMRHVCVIAYEHKCW